MTNTDVHCSKHEIKKIYPELKEILSEMLYELESNYLEVILIPQRDPSNVGACNRAAISQNCQWYRDICGDYESRRKCQYRKFKTKIRRQSIRRILIRLIDGKPSTSKYVEWIINYAEKQKRNIDVENYDDVPF